MIAFTFIKPCDTLCVNHQLCSLFKGSLELGHLTCSLSSPATFAEASSSCSPSSFQSLSRQSPHLAPIEKPPTSPFPSASFSFRSNMSSTPVPRRESPWGLPDGDTRQPKAHRCNDRAEDVVQACFEGNPFKTVPGPFKLFWRCMRSKPGEEPTEPFYHLQMDPPRREDVKLE